MSHLALGAGGEFDRIRAIARTLGPRAAPLGDDCAVIPDDAESLVLSTDVSVEGVHFRRAWLAQSEIGWRAAAAALSDLAADGARCVGLLVAVVVPGDAAEADVVALMDGVAAAAASVGGLVLGGDLSRGPQWSIAVTVVGRAARPVTRAGAAPGDTVWITGALGGAHAAVSAWAAGHEPSPAVRTAFARPEPRIAAGQWLAAHGATAMVDVSDGVVADARHLAAASGVAIELDLDLLPIFAGLAAPAGDDVALVAAAGGEDYELLATMPAQFAAADRDAFIRACGVPLTLIGVVQTGAAVRALRSGAPVDVRGYDHFGAVPGAAARR